MKPRCSRLLLILCFFQVPAFASPLLLPVLCRPLPQRSWERAAATPVASKSMPWDPFVQSLVNQVNEDSIAATIQRLQDFKTRYVLTDSNGAAAEWIEQKLALWGYSASLDSFYVNDTLTGLSPDSIFLSGYGHNVIASRAGSVTPMEWLLISGHYDCGPTGAGIDDCPGADDNGSGTAGVLEIARILSGCQTDLSVRFIGFDSEENGMRGPGHYAQKVDSAGEALEAIFDMDMIGYRDGTIPTINVLYGNHPWLGQLCATIGQLYVPGLSLSIIPELGWSTGPFEALGCPALTFTEPLNINPYYHTPQDLLVHLSPDQFGSVVKAALAMSVLLAVCPRQVADVRVEQTADSTSLALLWTANDESDVAGYWVWWGWQSGVYGDSMYVPGRLSTRDTVAGLQPSQIYYFIVRAVDGQGHYSLLAQEVSGVPFVYTLDHGILVVDETQNWTSGNLPPDSIQDRFYDSVLVGYRHTDYEFGAAAQRPIVSDYALYSTVLWHCDDYGQLLASGSVEDLKSYLDHGGNLWLVGWKPIGNLRNNATYPATFTDTSFIKQYLKVSGVNLSGLADSFQTAAGTLGYSSISVDPAKVPVSSWGGTMRYIESYTVADSADVIYAIDMLNNTSTFEGLPCGVRYLGPSFKTIIFGFPLFFMDRDQAKLAAQQVMADFGETSVTAPPSTPLGFRQLKLEQNTPNPFSRTTTIRYRLPQAGNVSLKVYNVAGQLVRTLAEGLQPAGYHEVRWDGRDDSKRLSSAGIYIMRLNIDGCTQTRKLMLVR